ncbi:MAG: UbiD family decarboxylase [Promethearchaeota archaeon]
MGRAREFLKELDQAGEVVHIRRAVSATYELAAVAKRLDGECVVFHEVRESPFRAVSGVVGSRDKVARALGVDRSRLTLALASAIRDPVEPKRVERAPCKEVVAWLGRDGRPTRLEANDGVDPPRNHRGLLSLPICTHAEGDGGPYVTAGVVVAEDPELGPNASFHRLMWLGGNEFAVRVVPRHLHEYLSRAGGELDVAVCVGNHPSVMLAAAVSTELGRSELAIANALRPLSVVRCETVDVSVPANAEIVLEGRITKRTAREGPFVDLTGTHDVVREQPVLEVRLLSHRRDPYYHALLPGGSEHRTCMGLPREPTIATEVSKVCRCLDVHLTDGGCGWLHGVVQIEKRDPGDPKRAIEAAFRGHPSMKHVFVVDPDVDPRDPVAVEWAMATRFQGSTGLHVYKDQVGSSLDPSADQDSRLTTKVGFDLTIPLARAGDARDKFLKVKFPGVEDVNLEVLRRGGGGRGGG